VSIGEEQLVLMNTGRRHADSLVVADAVGLSSTRAGKQTVYDHGEGISLRPEVVDAVLCMPGVALILDKEEYTELCHNGSNMEEDGANGEARCRTLTAEKIPLSDGSTRAPAASRAFVPTGRARAGGPISPEVIPQRLRYPGLPFQASPTP